jgi:exopolysaccharide biosynthesis protein
MAFAPPSSLGQASRRPARLAALLLLLALAAVLPAQAPTPLAEKIDNGVSLLHWSDPGLLSPPGPVAVHLLRLDPRRVDLRLVPASDGPPTKATVPDIARRHDALAAVNGGFFVVATGAPAGLLKVKGRLLSGTRLPRGAVGILGGSLFHPMRLVFDQVAAAKPAAGGNIQYRTRLGTATGTWSRARDIVGGAGLLVHDGRPTTTDDWAAEKMREGFATERHPRTMIGVDRSGAIWLVAVDGRNPLVSLGMSFAELQGLAGLLSLRYALNLDGGGSTTMVVRGVVVNRPSDITGPRPVSDALLVFPR